MANRAVPVASAVRDFVVARASVDLLVANQEEIAGETTTAESQKARGARVSIKPGA